MLRIPQLKNWHLAVLLPLFALNSYAQSERGTITGSIHDSSGAIIAGAKISVNNIATGSAVALTSNEAGEFTATSLAVGKYTVRVDKEGFRPSSITGIDVNAATELGVAVTTTPGA